jgi:hypothetical protein
LLLVLVLQLWLQLLLLLLLLRIPQSLLRLCAGHVSVTWTSASAAAPGLQHHQRTQLYVQVGQSS